MAIDIINPNLNGKLIVKLSLTITLNIQGIAGHKDILQIPI